MKKMSVFTLIIITFTFSTQWSLAMDCLGSLSCAKKEPQYKPIPQKEIKTYKRISPIEAHYDALIEKMAPLMDRFDAARIVEIVNNVKKYNITEQQLGLFAFKQKHPQNLNKQASIIIACVANYNRKIEPQNLSIITGLNVKMSRKIDETLYDNLSHKERAMALINCVELAEMITHKNDEKDPANTLAAHIGMINRSSQYWNEMAAFLYEAKKNDTDQK